MFFILWKKFAPFPRTVNPNPPQYVWWYNCITVKGRIRSDRVRFTRVLAPFDLEIPPLTTTRPTFGAARPIQLPPGIILILILANFYPLDTLIYLDFA